MTPVACFAAGHKKVYKTDLETMDIHFRRLLRSVVGLPSQTKWLNPWHEILHDWNARVARSVEEACILPWSHRSLQQYWHLRSYIASLPDARWVSGILAWDPRISENVGRHSGCGIPPRKCFALERKSGLEHSRPE